MATTLTPGTYHLSLTGISAGIRSAAAGSNGARYISSIQPVNDIVTDCNGNTHSPPLSGYLYGLASYGIYLIQSDGTSCLQSSLYNKNYGFHLQIPNSTAITFISSSCYILSDTSNNIWKGCHIPNNYARISAGYPPSNFVDNFTYTNFGSVTDPSTGVQTKVIASTGAASAAFSSGLWPNLVLDEIGGDGKGGPVIQYRSFMAQNSECILAWTDGNNNYLGSRAMWGVYPMGYAACHFPGTVVDGFTEYSAQADSYQMSPIFFNNQILLGGPFVDRSTEGVKINGTFTNWKITISTCSKANPVVCTSANNDLDAVSSVLGHTQLGVLVAISGATGTGWTGINGQFYAHRIDNNTFSLYSDPLGNTPINSSGFGTLGGTVVASMNYPLYGIPISNVINNGGNARMVASLGGSFLIAFPSGNLPIRDHDPISINSLYLSSTTQYYAKVTGAPTGDFDVFLDSGLAIPASFASLSNVAGETAVRSETCPDPSTLNLPGPFYLDTGIGASGNPKVRCVTYRLSDQICSDFTSSGEQALYPCSSDPSNTARSALHPIVAGDAFGDLTTLNYGSNEVMYVLKVTTVSLHHGRRYAHASLSG